MDIPKPEVLSYEDLRSRAERFLDQYWPSGEIPVDIEHIVDVQYGIDIVAVANLRGVADVDGFLSADGTEIYIDKGVYDHQVLYRYRFTLAHELAHLVLHQSVLAEANFSSPEEWLEFQNAIPEEDRSWLEWQAYALAGLILVPRDPLARRIRDAIEMAKAGDFMVDLREEAHRSYVATWVGRQFEVSQGVILRRGGYDGHWDR